jgi:hypothetical protein
MRRFIFSIVFGIIVSTNVYAYSGGAGTQDDPYIISSAADWQQLMNTSADWSKSFLMGADVNLAGVSLTPVGNNSIEFTGVFDGNSHVISNADINQPSNDDAGLFGYILRGQVKNLGVENATIKGKMFVGGLVGRNYGNIINCYSTGRVSGSSVVGGLVGVNAYFSIIKCYSTVHVSGTRDVGGLAGANCGKAGSISNCYSKGTVNGSSGNVGGLVGVNQEGSISNCYSTGQVSGGYENVGGLVGENDYRGSISNCYSTGQVSDSTYRVGGLVGYNGDGSISDCYSRGMVSGYYGVGGLVGVNCDNISNCYSTGQVSGSTDVGGLVGRNWDNISGSFWDIQTSAQTTSAGGEGKTTAEMKQISTFVNWDFVEIWGIEDNQTYPFLKLTYPVGDLNYDKAVNFFDFAISASHWLEEF